METTHEVPFYGSEVVITLAAYDNRGDGETVHVTRAMLMRAEVGDEFVACCGREAYDCRMEDKLTVMVITDEEIVCERTIQYAGDDMYTEDHEVRKYIRIPI